MIQFAGSRKKIEFEMSKYRNFCLRTIPKLVTAGQNNHSKCLRDPFDSTKYAANHQTTCLNQHVDPTILSLSVAELVRWLDTVQRKTWR